MGFLLTVALVWVVVSAVLWAVLLLLIVAERIGLLHGARSSRPDIEQLRAAIEVPSTEA